MINYIVVVVVVVIYYYYYYLYDMVLEADILFLLSASVLNIEHTDEISSPASKQTIENLKNDSWEHTQLRERVRQC